MKKIFKKLYYTFLLVLIISCYKICAQTEEVHFTRLSTKEGFSSNEINNIIRDSRGFMWFATPMGLHRWDGYEMKVFYNNPDSTNTLSASSICSIYEDGDSILWIGTFNSGLNKYHRNSENFSGYDIGNINQEENNQSIIWGIYKDFNKNLWLATAYGLIKFNPANGEFKRFVIGPSSFGTSSPKQAMNYFRVLCIKDDKTLLLGSRNGLVQFDISKETFIRNTFSGYSDDLNNVRGISSEGDGIFWIVTYQDGLFKYDSSTGLIKKYVPTISNGENGLFDRLTSVCVKSPDEIWIGSDNGLFKFNQHTNIAEVFKPDSRDITSISSSMIRTIYLDNEKNLWIGTMDRGVNFLPNAQKPYRLYKWDSENTNSLGRGFVTSICEDNLGNIWIGSWGGGLSCFLRKNRSYIHFTRSSKGSNHIPSNYINIIHCDTYNNIWIGTTGLYILNPQNGTVRFIDELNYRGIRSICNGTDGDLWIGFKHSGFARYNQRNNSFKFFAHEVNDSMSLSNNNITCMYLCKSGTLWVGTDDGLNKLDNLLSEKPALIRYYNNPDNINSISNNHISSIYEDSKERVWIGTDDGLNLYNPEIDGFRQVRVIKGLANNIIQNITEDNKGNLWIRWGEKLIKYNPDTRDTRIYDERDEFLPEGEYGGWNAVLYKGKSGLMYYGGVDEFISFDPNKLKDNPLPPPVVITNFLLRNKPVNIGKNSPLKKSITETRLLELTHTQNIISFEFAALDYTNPLKNQYAYKMEGVDEDWIFTDAARRYAAYTNLDPGEYIFRVKSSNNDGIWNEKGASVKIIILPPWWQTIWAYIAYIIIFIGAIYLSWRLQLRRIRIKHEYEMSRFEAEKLHEVDELKSRFFTNISHEFRTPLTLILGPVKQMIEKLNEGKIKDDLTVVHRNANKLLGLVNQLLDISKIESGSMRLETIPLNMITQVKSLVMQFSSYAERKSIDLKFNASEEEIIAYIDQEKIDKIITNILSNAFKFTPEGGCIEVIVSLPTPKSPPEEGTFKTFSSPLLEEQSMGNKEFVQISIRDTGIGIPKEKIPNIFDRFYQVNGSHKREQEGTGIGLSLTKELVELHKGMVKVESEEGRGTIFTIYLPLGKEHLKSEEIVEEEEVKITAVEIGEKAELILEKGKNDIDAKLGEYLFTVQTDKPLLLLVEDNYDVRNYIKDILKNDYKILEAEDGEDGWNKCAKFMPDLIISDVMMPKMDGFELCKKLKTDEKTSHIPIILLTAKASSNDKIEGFETGADEYIMKPFLPEILRVRIKNLIEQRERIHEYFKAQGIVDLDKTEVASIDKKFLQKVFKIITENISDSTFNVQTLAEKSVISYQVLYKKIVTLTGEQPVELIRRMRLKRAAELIENNFGNISEIAIEVGFNNPAYFSECFKKQFGLSPSQYNHKSFNN